MLSIINNSKILDDFVENVTNDLFPNSNGLYAFSYMRLTK